MTKMDIPNPQKEYWNIIATSVADDVAATHWVDENNRPVDIAMFAEIAHYLETEFLADKTPGQILEVGCGNSLILSELQRRIDPKWQLHGLDISEEMLRRTRASGLTLTCGEANRLQYDPGSFDLIFMHSVAQYFGSEAYLRQVIAECMTALRPGGTACLLDVPALWYRDLMGNRALGVMVRRKLDALLAQSAASLRRTFGGAASASGRQIEMINGVAVEVPKFSGYYADMNLFYDYRAFFDKITIEVQPFTKKPEIYRKFRFNVLMKGRNRVPTPPAAVS